MSSDGRATAALGVAPQRSFRSAVARALSRADDFVALTKPRVVVLIAIVTAAGFWQGAAARHFDPVRLLVTVLATSLAGGGALALNQLLERDLDARMARTRHRPIVTGRVSPSEALGFSVVLVTVGLAVLTFFVDPLAALVTAVTVVTYLFAYTPLKRRSGLCTVVGALPGALPPVTGWAAATGDLGPGAWALFGILFFWQLPHSLAIARIYREDYRAGGMHLLPVLDPGGSTGRQAVLNALALLGAGFLPALVGIAGTTYLVVAIVLGLGLLVLALRMAYADTVAAARGLFLGSLLYVPVLLLALGFDRLPR